MRTPTLLVAALAIGIAAAMLMGQARPAGRVIEAERFVLRGVDGKERAWLAEVKNVGPLLIFLDSNGNKRLGLGIGADSALQRADAVPLLSFVDENGQERLTAQLDSSGPQLILYNSRRRSWATIKVWEHTPEYRRRYKIPDRVLLDGDPSISLTRDMSTTWSVLGADSLSFQNEKSNKDDKVVWRAP